MSEPDDAAAREAARPAPSRRRRAAGSASAAAGYLSVIRHELREAENALREGERLRVLVYTPEVLIEAVQLDCLDPEVLVVHGVREGRRTTLIAPIDSAQIVIEALPFAREQKPREIGFRVQE